MAEAARVVTGKHLALLLNCKPSYITELKRNGRLVLSEDGKGYLAAESVALYESTRDPSRAGVAARHAAARAQAAAAAATPPPTRQESPDTAPEDCEEPLQTGDAKRRAKALADKAVIDALAAQRDYDQSMGRLLPADQVDQALSAAAVNFRTSAERMVDVLAPQLAALSDEGKCRQLLWDEVAHMLEELSRGFRGAGKPATA